MKKVFKITLRVLLRLDCGHRDPRPEVEDTGEPPSKKLVTEASREQRDKREADEDESQGEKCGHRQ